MKAARDDRPRPPGRDSELCELEWAQVEWGRNASLHVRRAKNGKPAVHPLRGDEIRALRELQRQSDGRYVFQTERGGPFTTDAINRQLKRIAEQAGFRARSFPYAPPRLRLRVGQCRSRHAGNSGLARSIDVAGRRGGDQRSGAAVSLMMVVWDAVLTL
jgi:integrase